MTWRYAWHCPMQLNRPRGSYQNPPGGSGGGYSQLFAQPGWQVGFSASQYRGYPDVAADAGPATGAYICYDDPQQGSTCIGDIGGTSLATPMWAGMIADVEQYVQAQGELPLGFVNPLLYTLASNAGPYPAYHDIKAGTNGNYNAGQGWDAVTGLGSPDLYNLARDAASLYRPNSANVSTLESVAAISATDVWAVGLYYNGEDQTLIEHWDGSSWSVVSSPNSSAPDNVLSSVAAVSASDVWAVGYAATSNGNQTLIGHWDGTSWNLVPSPNSSWWWNALSSVAVVSASDVWAVGSINNGSQTLIDHWNGSGWSVVPSPNP